MGAMPVSTRRMSAASDDYSRPRYQPTDRPSESSHRMRRVRARTPVEDDVTPRRSPRRTAVNRSDYHDVVPRRASVGRVASALAAMLAFLAEWIAALLGGVSNAGASAAGVVGNGLGEFTRAVANGASDVFLALVRALGSIVAGLVLNTSTDGVGLGVRHIDGAVGFVATAIYRKASAATLGAVAAATFAIRALVTSRGVEFIFQTVHGTVFALAGGVGYGIVTTVDVVIDGLVTVGGRLETGAFGTARVVKGVANGVVIGAREGVDGAANFVTFVASSMVVTLGALASAGESLVLALPASLAAAVRGVGAGVAGSVGRIGAPRFGRRPGASDENVASDDDDDDDKYTRTRHTPRAAVQREEAPHGRRRVSSRVDPGTSLATDTTPRRARASVSTGVSSPRVATPRARTSSGTRRVSMSTRSMTRSQTVSRSRRVGVALIGVASNFDPRLVGGTLGRVAAAAAAVVGGGFETSFSMLLLVLRDLAVRIVAAFVSIGAGLVIAKNGLLAAVLVASNAFATAVSVAAKHVATAARRVLNSAADGAAFGVETAQRAAVAAARAVAGVGKVIGVGAVVSLTFLVIAVVGVCEATLVGTVVALKAATFGLIVAARATAAALLRVAKATGKFLVVSVTFLAIAVVAVVEAVVVGTVVAVKQVATAAVFATTAVARAVPVTLNAAADGVALCVKNLDGAASAVAGGVAVASTTVAFRCLATCKAVASVVLAGYNSCAGAILVIATAMRNAVGAVLDTAADGAAFCVFALDGFLARVVSVFVALATRVGKGVVVSLTFSGVAVVGVVEAIWVGVVVAGKTFVFGGTTVAYAAVKLAKAALDRAADCVALCVDGAARVLENAAAAVGGVLYTAGAGLVGTSKFGVTFLEHSTLHVLRAVTVGGAVVAAAPAAIGRSAVAPAVSGLAKVTPAVYTHPAVLSVAGLGTSVAKPVVSGLLVPVTIVVNFTLPVLQYCIAGVVSSTKTVANSRAFGFGIRKAAGTIGGGVLQLACVVGDRLGSLLDNAADSVGFSVSVVDGFFTRVVSRLVASGKAIGVGVVVSATVGAIAVVGVCEAIFVGILLGAKLGAKAVSYTAEVTRTGTVTALGHLADCVGLGVAKLDFAGSAVAGKLVAVAKFTAAGFFNSWKCLAFALWRGSISIGRVLIAVKDVALSAFKNFARKVGEVLVFALHRAADGVGLGVASVDGVVETVVAAVTGAAVAVAHGTRAVAKTLASAVACTARTLIHVCLVLRNVPVYVRRRVVALVERVASQTLAVYRRFFPKDSAARHTRRADSRKLAARVGAAAEAVLRRVRAAVAALQRLWRELVLIIDENAVSARTRVTPIFSRAAGITGAVFGFGRYAPRCRRRADPAAFRAITPTPRGPLSALATLSPLIMSPAMLSPYSPASPLRAWTRAASRAANEPLVAKLNKLARGFKRGALLFAKRLATRVSRTASKTLREIATRVPPMGSDARRNFDMTLFTLACVVPVAFAYTNALRASGLRVLLIATAATCLVCYGATSKLTATVQRLTLKRGMFGYDINKKGTPAGEIKVPEAVGLAPAAVFLASLSLLQVAHMWLGGDTAKDWAVEHNSALATIGFAVFLGFVDDVLELPWRAKMILPSFAAMPLLLSYAGSTTILVPKPLRKLMELALGTEYAPVSALLDLGPLYYVYMFLLTIFCTNSINIHAGLNGLEAGQSAVIATAMVLLNVCTIAATGERAPEVGADLHAAMTPQEAFARATALRAALGGRSDFAAAAAREAQNLLAMDTTAARMHDAHVFSLCLTAPFLACTLGLLSHNWYPSRVFVGDTYTYFAGMTLGVAGILGHFSETLVLFFLPQIANFLYSGPQLFKLVPCPRHRLPRLDVTTGLLHPSFVTTDEGERRVNMNLVNLFLQILGPQTERTLCLAMLALQAGCCALGFGVRAVLTGVWK